MQHYAHLTENICNLNQLHWFKKQTQELVFMFHLSLRSVTIDVQLAKYSLSAAKQF